MRFRAWIESWSPCGVTIPNLKVSSGPNVFGVHVIGLTTTLSLAVTVGSAGAVPTTISGASTETVSRRVIATDSAGAAMYLLGPRSDPEYKLPPTP